MSRYVVADRLVRHGSVSPTLLIAWLTMLYPGMVHAALPSATEDASVQKPAPVAADATTASNSGQESTWIMPAVRFGGVLSYNLRRNISEEQKNLQQGLSATLNASTSSFIWQPWFARVNGAIGWTMLRDSSETNGTASFGNSSSKNSILTGRGQLTVLEQSKFPFEAHFDSSDSRISNDLALANGYASQRYGFTQRYAMPQGDSTLGWDRSTQTSANSGRDRQDVLQLNLSRRMEHQNVQLAGNSSTNTRESSGEKVVQNNLSLQHSYIPDPTITLENTANLSRTDNHLQHGGQDTRLVQLSSFAFWRPADQAMTVTGGARVLALESDAIGLASNSNAAGARVFTANANAGVNYELNRFTRINASVNLNLAESNGEKSTNSNQSVGASYQPDAIELGGFRYNWSTSGNASNQAGGKEAVQQLALQLSHGLSRSVELAGGSVLGIDGNQGVSAISSSSESGGDTQQLTHSASLSWNLAQESGAALLRLSASDSRALAGRQEFFQLINLQASSNLPTSGNSSWTGNLTIQAVRQGGHMIADSMNPLSPQTDAATNNGFVTSSSGSITYQNQRVFGIRRLRFVSDLRLNGQALLPLLGSAKDQETAAWDNHFDYTIGLTQLRLSAQVSSSSTVKRSIDPATGAAKEDDVRKINKSIMFAVTRSFGSF